MKTVELRFNTNELLYDIKSIAYTIADSSASDNEKAKRNLKDIAEEGNIDRVIRIIELKLGICRERLYAFTKHPVVQDVIHNNTERDCKVYCIRMLLPDDFSETTIELLNKLIHEYIVYSVLIEWMSITGFSSDAMFTVILNKENELMDQIKESLSARIKRVHRRMSPF